MLKIIFFLQFISFIASANCLQAIEAFNRDFQRAEGLSPKAEPVSPPDKVPAGK